MPINSPSARINSTGLLLPNPTRAKHTPRRPQSVGGRIASGSRPKTRLTCSRARCCSLPSALGLNSSTLRVMTSKRQQKESARFWRVDNLGMIHLQSRNVDGFFASKTIRKRRKTSLTHRRKAPVSTQCRPRFSPGVRLCPYSSEVVFRYVNLLLSVNRKDDAILVVKMAF